jgi:anti-sigma B factor antagonist
MTAVAHDRLDAITPALPPEGPVPDAPPPDAPMVIVTVSCPQPDTTVCRVAGRLGLVNAPVLAGELSEAVRNGRPHVVIDLSALTLLGSIGIPVIVAALGSCDIDGHLAVVVGPRSTVMTRPDRTALGEVMDIHHDLASALRGCARASISTGGRHRAKATD